MELQGINHIVLKVRSLVASDRFYREVLEMQRVGERPGMWFYHAGGHHHDLALVEVGQASAPQRHQTGLFHLCFNVSDEQALAQLYHRCQAADIPILGTADHTVMRSFYVLDPDNHVVEFGVDVPKEEWADLAAPFAQDSAYFLPEIA